MPAAADPTRQTCILVLGMHRSGTSAVTRVLSLMGAALPRNMMGADLGNDLGHWEPETLVVLNDNLLASVERDWADWRRIERPVDPDIESTLAYEISWQYRGQTPFVLKDPRVCLLVPSYERALESIGARTLNAFVLRSPMACGASLAKRNGVTIELGCLLWLRYLLEAERATRGRQRVFVRYDDMLANWRTALADVAAQSGLRIPAAGSAEAKEIDGFVRPTERHHGADPLVADGPLGDWLARAEAALDRIAAQPDDTAAQSALDDVHGEFDAATMQAGRDPTSFGRVTAGRPTGAAAAAS